MYMLDRMAYLTLISAADGNVSLFLFHFNADNTVISKALCMLVHPCDSRLVSGKDIVSDMEACN